jgi:phosphonatase-like hydrolase
MIRMVVFDMAGTTIDEGNVVYKTLQVAMKDHGFDFTLEQVLAEGAGKEKQQAIQSVLKLRQADDVQLSEEIFKHFTILLNEAYGYLDPKPQPNAVELFRILKEQHIFIVLNTGYRSETAWFLVDKLGWRKGQEFDDLITASDVKNCRPHADMILLAMHKFGIQNPLDVVKVGDSITDIEEGKNAGCGLSIGITTGAHSREQLLSANPDFIINNLLEIPAMIKRYDAG